MLLWRLWCNGPHGTMLSHARSLEATKGVTRKMSPFFIGLILGFFCFLFGFYIGSLVTAAKITKITSQILRKHISDLKSQSEGR